MVLLDVDSFNDVYYCLADWALSHVLTAWNAREVMLTRHKKTVLLVLVANATSVSHRLVDAQITKSD